VSREEKRRKKNDSEKTDQEWDIVWRGGPLHVGRHVGVQRAGGGGRKACPYIKPSHPRIPRIGLLKRAHQNTCKL